MDGWRIWMRKNGHLLYHERFLGYFLMTLNDEICIFDMVEM